MSANPRPAWLAEFPRLSKTFDAWVGRNVLPKPAFDALAQEMKTQAFSATGTMAETQLKTLLDNLGKAIVEGMTTAEWRALTKGIFESTAYADLVYQTNVTNAFDGAAYGEMFEEPDPEFPAWRFNAAIDDHNDEEAECPNLICRKLDGKIFSKDDEASFRYLPKVHWGCRCFASEVSAGKAGHVTAAAGLGVEPDEDWNFDKRALIPGAFRVRGGA